MIRMRVGHIHGILSNKRYTQRDFKLSLSSILKASEVKDTDYSKKITLKNNFRICSVRILIVYHWICRNSFFYETSTTKKTFSLFDSE